MKEALIIAVFAALIFSTSTVIHAQRGVADVQSCFSAQEGNTGQLQCEVFADKRVTARIIVTQSTPKNSEKCSSQVPFSFNASLNSHIGTSAFHLPAGTYQVELKIKKLLFFYKIIETKEVKIKTGKIYLYPCPFLHNQT